MVLQHILSLQDNTFYKKKRYTLYRVSLFVFSLNVEVLVVTL